VIPPPSAGYFLTWLKGYIKQTKNVNLKGSNMSRPRLDQRRALAYARRHMVMQA